jgi:hypothetical protein
VAITYVGSAVGTTSASLPTGWQPGDLAIVAAYRDGSNTAPTVPSGWTSVLSTSGNTNSLVVGRRILQAGDTGTGTWTNATNLVVHVYRGIDPATPVGASAGTGAQSTTVTYPALTLQVTDGTSWVAGFAGHRSVDTAIETPPTGMTNRSDSLNATAELAGHDTNGGVASWSQQSVSVGGTSSGWRSCTVEIRAAPGQVVELSGSISISGAVVAGATATYSLTGGLGSTATLAGSLTAVRPLAGAIATTATLGGTLARLQSLSGSLAATSTIAGDAMIRRGLAGAVAATAAASGSLGVRLSIGGTITSTTTAAGTITVIRELAGQIAAAGTLSGDATIRRGLAGDIVGSATVAADPTVRRGLAGSISASGATTVDATIRRGLAGHIAGATTVAADAAVLRWLAGAIAAVVNVGGALVLGAGGQLLLEALTARAIMEALPSRAVQESPTARAVMEALDASQP